MLLADADDCAIGQIERAAIGGNGDEFGPAIADATVLVAPVDQLLHLIATGLESPPLAQRGAFLVECVELFGAQAFSSDYGLKRIDVLGLERFALILERRLQCDGVQDAFVDDFDDLRSGFSAGGLRHA